MATPVEHPVPQPSCPCLNLASARQRIGISLEQIAQATRIAPHYLRAIEAEDFAKVPTGVYATSYIRQYARAIGYSEAALLDHYRARRQQEPPPADAGPPSPRVTSRLGEALAEAVELFHWRSPAKPRTHHPA
jgi:transcriptional regulator with XRE-family HTH domain